jgi:hypothetical protein
LAWVYISTALDEQCGGNNKPLFAGGYFKKAEDEDDES